MAKERTERVTIDPVADCWQELHLSDGIVRAYSLDTWSEEFSLMTAGYRDRLDPEDANNPEAPFNLLTVAILAEAKARVFEAELASGETGSVHLGGEVRPHTQSFIKVAARVYAAHGFKVHLRKGLDTTPIWYSSFGVAYEEYGSGDNFTASHSQYFKGGWKPLDSEGKQLLAEEEQIVEAVHSIVGNRETIRLSPLKSSPLILDDFDVDAAYASYQESVLGKELLSSIEDAGASGFRCYICTLGGSMKATSEKLFARFGVSTGDDGVIRYLLGEEDSQYHNVGLHEGKDLGVDPGTPLVYRNVGAQQILLRGAASLVIIWDPDGDRLKVATVAPASEEAVARAAGLEVDECGDGKSCVVYLTPNQLYLLLAAFRIDVLRGTGKLGECDWFIGASLPTSKSLDELAAAEGIPCVRVPVGFKHIGDLCDRIETQLTGDAEVSVQTVTGETVVLGHKPRALILCEESGGATLGGSELLTSRTGARRILALREKDGMQIGLLTLALAARLYTEQRSLVSFYCALTSSRNVRYLHYHRADVRLYDEGLMGEELRAAKDEGMGRRDRVMAFFQELVRKHQAGELTLQDIREGIDARRVGAAIGMPALTAAHLPGDGVLLESDDLRFILRASGTDALLRYYLEAKDSAYLEAVQEMLVSLDIE